MLQCQQQNYLNLTKTTHWLQLQRTQERKKQVVPLKYQFLLFVFRFSSWILLVHRFLLENGVEQLQRGGLWVAWFL